MSCILFFDRGFKTAARARRYPSVDANTHFYVKFKADKLLKNNNQPYPKSNQCQVDKIVVK